MSGTKTLQEKQELGAGNASQADRVMTYGVSTLQCERPLISLN